MRRRSNRPLAALALATTLLFTGCGGTVSSTGEAVESVVGTWSSDETGEPHLTFTDDGQVSGSDGCNSIGTTYEQDGSTVTLEPSVSTLMGCPGVDTWLRDARTLEIDGSAMTVKDAQDEEIGTLTRD